MRAYRQVGRAICFLKWEDFLQKKLNLPPWRVFAAAQPRLTWSGSRRRCRGSGSRN